MNPLPPNDSREVLEARITALILGELSSPDAAELEQRIAADPQLVALRHRLQKAANLLREACASAESGAVSSAPAEKLSPTKREVLLARFKILNPPVVAPKKKARLPSWIIPVTLTACVIVLAASMLLPSLSKPKYSFAGLRRHDPESASPSAQGIPSLTLAEPELRESIRHLSEVAQTTQPTKPASAAPSKHWDEDSGRKALNLDPAVRSSPAPQEDRLARDRVGATSLGSSDLAVAAPSQPEASLDFGKSAESLSREQVTDLSDRLAVNGVERENVLAQSTPVEPGGAVTGNAVRNYADLGRQMAGKTLFIGDETYGGFGTQPARDAKEFAETASTEGRADWFFGQNVNGPQQGQTLGYATDKLQAKDGAVALADAEKEVEAGNIKVLFDDHSLLQNESLSAGTEQSREKKVRTEERVVGDLTRPIELAKPESAADKSEPTDAYRRRYALKIGAAGATTRAAGRTSLGVDRGLAVPPPAPVVANPTAGELPAGVAELDARLKGSQTAPAATPAPNVYSLDVSGYVNVGPGSAGAKLNASQPGADGARSGGAQPARSAPSQPIPVLVTPVTGTELALATNSVLAAPKVPAQESEVMRLKVNADAFAARPPTPAPVPQPEVAAAENPFSTFSLNVSDVSFRLATTALANGQMPDVSTIRSEEFVNAFDYRDPAPAPDAPVAMTWERARYPFAHNRDLIRIAVKTAGTGRESGRALNLVLLMDNSGSMERADRVAIIREALRVLGTKLQSQDKLTVITFSRTPMLRIDGLSGAAAVKVLPELEGLTPEGGTNLEEAMGAAYASAMRHYIAGGMNRVVLLTDGAANLGDIDPERLRATVAEHRKKGIALDCFGIGFEGYDDEMLEALSRNGDGRYAFINTPEAAATEFAGKLAGALQIAASDVKVQVEFNPARVNVYRQIGYAKHQLTKEQFRDNAVDAAEIAALESGNALYTVELKPDGTGPVGTVRVRYKVPGTGDYHEYEWAMPYTGNAPSLAQSTPALRLAATSAGFAEWLVSSPWAGEVTPDDLISLMQGIPQHYAPDARPTRLLEAIRQAKSISGR